MLTEIARRPEIDGQRLEVRYFRETEVDADGRVIREIARWPQSYRILPNGPLVTDPVLVETVCHALFERDGLAGIAWPIVQAILPPPLEDGTVAVSVHRLDVGNALVIGIGSGSLSAEEIEAYGAEVATALAGALPDEVASGRVAVVWEAPR
ncbi:MAG: hypothetical protein Q8J78_03625 [Moraxellaceae bacterium]|nr:hypothetical protein [Moraxellaceae bacterium]